MNTVTKVAVYAAAGVTDYWVIDLDGRVLRIFRNPQNSTYATQFTFSPTDTVSW